MRDAFRQRRRRRADRGDCRPGHDEADGRKTQRQTIGLRARRQLAAFAQKIAQIADARHVGDDDAGEAGAALRLAGAEPVPELARVASRRRADADCIFIARPQMRRRGQSLLRAERDETRGEVDVIRVEIGRAHV